MQTKPIIYVVDDDSAARESACAFVSEMALDHKAYSSAEEFLSTYDGHRPACLLTDHRMLGMTGVELLEALRAKGITLSVIVMTAYAETELTVRAIKSGAITLIEKPFSNGQLWKAVHEALAADRVQHADEATKRKICTRLETLTDSEMEVLRLIVKGETNKATAFQLGVSVRTVENRRSSIFEKMGVVSIAELVQQAMTADAI